MLIHNAAMKILNATHLNLYNFLKKEDKYKEGIVSIKAAQRVIEERGTVGVDPTCISLLIQKSDRQNRGFLVITEFLKMVEQLADDSEYEKILKRFAKKLGSSIMTL